MVRLHFLNEKGWELPDFYDCGPKDFESEKHALEIVADALSREDPRDRLGWKQFGPEQRPMVFLVKQKGGWRMGPFLLF